jgi:Zn-dependent protease with chaperone function
MTSNDRRLHSLEQYAQRHPKAYQWRVAALTLFGYAYPIALFSTLAFLLWPFSHYYTLMILLGLGKLFWLKTEAPTGILATAADYPDLFAELATLQQKLCTPPIHQVLLTDDLNAAVLQLPRLGLLGWYRNYLILGIPLMQISSTDQFRATLAHELGHLSANHSRIANWVYRVRYAWESLGSQNIERPSIFLRPFFRWYEPFFRTYSFVMSRNDEYFADRCAADCTGAENAADDLMQLSIRGQYWYADYWKTLWQSPEKNTPEQAISGLIDHLTKPLAPDLAAACRVIALARPKDAEDTHPSLHDRLNQYGLLDRPSPPPPRLTAAQNLLGDRFLELLSQLDQRWKDLHQILWLTNHYHRELTQQFIAHLRKLAAPTPEQQWKLAMLEAPGDPQSAIKLLQSALASNPEHPSFNYDLGCLLLDQGERLAFRHLEVAFRANPVALAWSFEAIYRYLSTHDRVVEAQGYLAQFQAVQGLRKVAEVECDRLTAKDGWLPHGLDDLEVAQISRCLGQFPEIREAHLVRKQLRSLPDWPLYVLAVRSGINRLDPINSREGPALVAAVTSQLCLSGSVRILPVGDGNSGVYRSIRRVAGSKLSARSAANP